VNASGLIEKERVNFATYSEDATNGVYSKTNISVTGNNATAPDGSLTADTITATANGATLQATSTISNGGVYTMSVYIKRRTGTGQIGLRGVNNLVTNVTITNDWQRYEVFMVANSTIGRYGVYLATDGDEVDVWGFQINYGSVATDYIATTTAAVYEGITDNLPRLDYSGGASCPSLLLEPSRTNLITQSEYFGAWTLEGGTQSITDNYAISPEGVQNATRAQFDKTGVSYSSLKLSVSGTSSSTSFVYSVYLKANSGSPYVYLQAGPNFSTAIEVTNEWQRYELIGTASGGTTSCYIGVSDSVSGTTETADILVYGAQLESSATYKTSYIPTYGTSASRAADDITQAFSTPVPQNGGTFFIELKGTPAGTGSSTPFLQFNHSNSSSYVGFGANSAWRCRINDNGTARLVSSPIAHTEDVKLCIRYGDFGYEYYANGASFSTYGTAIDLGDLESITYVESSEFYGNIEIKQLLSFPTALTDAECIALTTI
jgi:hypothetical protein